MSANGVRPVATISRKDDLAAKFRAAFNRIAESMTAAELERAVAYAARWPFDQEQLAELADARAAVEYDLDFIAQRDAAGRLPAMAKA